MKRIVYVILLVCLLAGLVLPTTAMATAVTVLDAVDITGIQTPVIGEAPSVVGVQAENCEVVVLWENDYGDTVEQFENGKSYTVHIELYPMEGFAFREDTVITINGEDPNIFYYAEADCGYAAQRYSFCELIETVQVEIPAVEVGSVVPREVIIPEEANYTAEVVWYVWDNEAAFVEYEGDTFQNGKIYCLEVSAYPNEGYEFDEAKTTLVMDGEPAVYCWNTCLMAEICYTFGAENQVEKIELTGLQLPKDGNLVNLDSIQVAEGTNCTLIGAVWMESETGDINSEEWELAEKFQAGKYYALVIMTSPADGYMFGEDIPILIDGQEVQPDVRESTAYSDLSVLVFEVSEETPEQKPEDTPEDKPENTPEQKPEDQPEQKPEKDPEAVTPATSDAFMHMPLIGLMVLSALGVLVVAAWKKYNFA